VLCLLKHNFDLHRVDIDGKTLLHHAAEHCDADLVEFLCPLMNVDVEDLAGRTAWSYVSFEQSKEDDDSEDDDLVSASDNHLEHFLRIFDSFMYHGAVMDKDTRINMQNAAFSISSHKVLHIAPHLFCSDDVNEIDKDGNTDIYYAVFKRNSVLVSYLKDIGARIDMRDNENRLPLYWAIENCDVECVRELMTPEFIEEYIYYITPELASALVTKSIDADPSLRILGACVKSLSYRTRTVVRTTVMCLQKTLLPKEIFPMIAALAIDNIV
jgi:ankyrin repeat protein